MNVIEAEAKKRRAYRNLQNAVLAAIAVSGIIAVMLIAPNIFQAVPRLMGKSSFRAKFGYRARTAAARLAERGLVRFTLRGGKKYVEITERGRRELQMLQMESALKKRRRWDKRYRMVIFDVPEKRRKTRAKLRRIVERLGFLRLQDSVWIFPHECEEVVALIKADLRVGKDVLYVIAEGIENDGWVKKHFGLPG